MIPEEKADHFATSETKVDSKLNGRRDAWLTAFASHPNLAGRMAMAHIGLLGILAGAVAFKSFFLVGFFSVVLLVHPWVDVRLRKQMSVRDAQVDTRVVGVGLSETHVHLTRPTSASHIEWGAFRNVRTTDSLIAIGGPLHRLLLDHRDFDKSYEELLGFIEDKVAPSEPIPPWQVFLVMGPY